MIFLYHIQKKLSIFLTEVKKNHIITQKGKNFVDWLNLI